MSIDLEYEKKYESIVKSKMLELCKDKKCRIFLFGSRAKSKITRSSDFDIGIIGLTDNEIGSLKTAFFDFLEESIVPYSVDIINFDKVDPDFKKGALQNIKLWKAG